jgi:predicted DNA-binding protein
MPMKRTQLYLPEYQHQALKKVADKKGTTISEIIRRIVDDYIDNNDKKRVD